MRSMSKMAVLTFSWPSDCDGCSSLVADMFSLRCCSRYFSRAFTAWAKQNKFTAAFISSLISHTEAEHAAGAWLLLSKVVGSSSKLPDNCSKILEAWERTVRSETPRITEELQLVSWFSLRKQKCLTNSSALKVECRVIVVQIVETFGVRLNVISHISVFTVMVATRCLQIYLIGDKMVIFGFKGKENTT